MKNIKTRLAAWIGLLAVCLLPLGARAAEQQKSGIIGLVETHNWTVEVYSESNNVDIYVQPDRDGFFKVDLQPGNYVLTPITIHLFPPAGPGQVQSNVAGVIVRGPSRVVKVVKNRFTLVGLPTEPNDFHLPLGSPPLPAGQQP